MAGWAVDSSHGSAGITRFGPNVSGPYLEV